MSLRFGSMVVGAAAVLASFSFASNDAHACGGCFHGPTPIDQPDQATVVTGHRMALSVSMDRTILWDQIQYAGQPEDFAWVLPVRPGAFLELANDAFFEALDAATSTTVRAPQIFCPDNSGGGDFYGDDYGGGSGCNAFACGAYAAAGDGAYESGGGGGAGGGNPIDNPPDPVAVVHKASIGPYETVTIHSNVPGALFTWLDSHGYVVDDSLQPMIDDYESEGFDFIALRLIPGQDVQQMAPVRVVTPGASPVLPLRMVSAGTGANVAITLFVIGEGRWLTQNFPGDSVTGEDVAWDFSTSSSNYGEVRNAALAAQDGRVWLTAYARQGALTEQLFSNGAGQQLSYLSSDNVAATSLWQLYMAQGQADGAEIDFECWQKASPAYGGNPKIVAPCGLTDGGGAGGGGAGGSGGGGAGGGGAGGGTGGAGGSMCSGDVGPDEMDAREFSCGELDDMAAALVGLHPKDVWVTRLEANLPHAALDEDLGLQADPSQGEVDNWMLAGSVANPPCADWQYFDNQSGAGTIIGPGGSVEQKPPRRTPSDDHRRDLILVGVALAAVAGAVGRRLARPQLRNARVAR